MADNIFNEQCQGKPQPHKALTTLTQDSCGGFASHYYGLHTVLHVNNFLHLRPMITMAIIVRAQDRHKPPTHPSAGTASCFYGVLVTHMQAHNCLQSCGTQDRYKPATYRGPAPPAVAYQSEHYLRSAGSLRARFARWAGTTHPAHVL